MLKRFMNTISVSTCFKYIVVLCCVKIVRKYCKSRPYEPRSRGIYINSCMSGNNHKSGLLHLSVSLSRMQSLVYYNYLDD